MTFRDEKAAVAAAAFSTSTSPSKAVYTIEARCPHCVNATCDSLVSHLNERAVREREWARQVDRAYEVREAARTRNESPYRMPRGTREVFVAATHTLTASERMIVFDSLDARTQDAFWDDLARQVREARGDDH